MEVSANTLGGASLGGAAAVEDRPSPVATCRESSLMLNAQTIVQTILTGTNKVMIGLDNIEASRNFFKLLQTTGTYAIILPATNDNIQGQNEHYDLKITMLLYFGWPQQQSCDFILIQNQWTAIRDALMLQSSWTNNPPPEKMFISPPEARTDLPNYVYLYTFEMMFIGAIVTR